MSRPPTHRESKFYYSPFIAALITVVLFLGFMVIVIKNDQRANGHCYDEKDACKVLCIDSEELVKDCVDRCQLQEQHCIGNI